MRRLAAALVVLVVLALAGSGCSADTSEPAERSHERVPTSDRPTEHSSASPPPVDDDAGVWPLPSLARPVGPRQAAVRVRIAEQVIADPAAPARDLRAMARVQQLAYRELGVHPEWDRAFYRFLPARLHAVARHNIAARRDFRSMHTTLSDTLPAWRIVRPAPAPDLMRFYRDAEAAYGVGWEYLAAVNLVETAMGRIRGTSVAGAQGPMQFLPSTWARWGRGDIDDPADAIMAAARYLSANGFTRGPGGVANALFEYNNHPAYVRGVTHYAQVMERRPSAFLAYHQWDVYYLTTRGDVLLPVGYHRARPVPVRRYVATHPQR